MRSYHHKNAFSLTEVLLAVGTLAIGLIFISGTFLAGIHFSTIATERTIAAIATDEAFAKIKIYGIDPNDPNLSSNQLVNFEVLNPIDPNEFAYPSTRTAMNDKQYFWSALCRRETTDPNDRLVQVRIFMCRKVGSGTTYQGGTGDRPIPLTVSVSGTVGSYVLTIEEADKISWINDSDTIVDDENGDIYRVLKRYPTPGNTILLDRAWQGSSPSFVWVVPPPIGSGRKPCIAVYPKGSRF